MSQGRPDWSLVRRALLVWAEDDATVSLTDHENLSAAFERTYHVPVPEPLEVHDDGDAVYKRLPGNLVLCASYPGNSSIHAWPTLKVGDPVTVVLKWPNNVELGQGRCVHTTVSTTWRRGDLFDTFSADDDDRPVHKVTDHTVTWLLGHVDLRGKKAFALQRAAEQADVEREEGRSS